MSHCQWLQCLVREEKPAAGAGEMASDSRAMSTTSSGQHLEPRGRRWWLAYIAAVAIAALAACSDPGLPPVRLGGTWAGTLASSVSQPGNLQLLVNDQPLIQTPTGGATQHLLTGTWSVSYPSPTRDDSGSFQGWAWTYTDTVTLELTDSSKCSIDLVGTRTGAPSISGHYTTSQCAGADSGTFAIAPQ